MAVSGIRPEMPTSQSNITEYSSTPSSKESRRTCVKLADIYIYIDIDIDIERKKEIEREVRRVTSDIEIEREHIYIYID